MEQNRFKSWALWLSVGSLIVYVVKKTTGLDFGPVWDELSELLLPVLAGFGIINNPKDKQNL